MIVILVPGVLAGAAFTAAGYPIWRRRSASLAAAHAHSGRPCPKDVAPPPLVRSPQPVLPRRSRVSAADPGHRGPAMVCGAV